MSSSVRGASIAFTLLCVLSAPARAATIYTTFGPGDSFSVGGGYVIGATFPTEDPGAVAASFVPGFDATLESISIATDHSGGLNSYTVYLAANSGGLPGDPIETFANVSFTSPATVLTLNSVLNPDLSAGTTYWIVLQVADITQFSSGHWSFNDQGINGLVAGKPFLDSGWLLSSQPFSLPAFAVHGAAVPEPVVSVLLLVGAGVATIRRRRLRRHPVSGE